ncbi:MAG: hypothetical protein EOP07_15445 [Proteobacteria bacterium]|nr:MAG: hypothetical protein EOP07_15445 [Pseudomonadota bacterium]
MRIPYFALLLALTACKQYVPQGASYASSKGQVTLAGSACKNQNVTYVTQEPSALSWSFAQTKGDTNESSTVSFKTPAQGEVVLKKGLLNQASGFSNFASTATTSGDAVLDRLVQEILLGSSTAQPFRILIEQISGSATAVANGASVDMKATGMLEIAGRKAAVSMPVKISEKDGVFSLEGSIALNARESRPSINAMDLDDKLKILEGALASKIDKMIELDFSIQLKNACVANVQ